MSTTMKTRLPILNSSATLSLPENPPDDYALLINSLASVALAKFQSRPASHRLLISISGIPGSGKTTLAADVVERINTIVQLQFGVPIAAVVGMDGFHYTRDQLSQMKDPEEAKERRGAAFTFDVDGIKKLVERLKEPVRDDVTGKLELVWAPSFDHAVKDPIPNDIAILPTQRIVILEGNYLALKQLPLPSDSESESDWTTPSTLWREVAGLFDVSWYVDTSIDIARERLATRHLAAGICSTMEEAVARADGSDRRNSLDIVRWRGAFDKIVSGEVPRQPTIAKVKEEEEEGGEKALKGPGAPHPIEVSH